MKILVVEDDSSINGLICEALTRKGYTCVSAFSGTEARLYTERESFAVIILDLMLPGMTGEEFLHTLRPGNSTPVIVLSAKDALDSKLAMLSAGADDYMTKPFRVEELCARVEVQLRKSDFSDRRPTRAYKQLSLDYDSRKAILCGQPISLTNQEFKILELLLSNPKKVFSKQEIYTYAWDSYYVGEDKTINVHISNIRQKCKSVTPEEYIETVWGIGFKLAD